MKQEQAGVGPFRGDLHESRASEITRYERAMGVALFTTSEGGILVKKEGDQWSLPMHPVPGRDAAPIRIPRTVAQHVLGIDPELPTRQRPVGVIDEGHTLYIIVKAQLPNRLRISDTKLVKSDSCLAKIGDESFTSIFHRVIEHVRKHQTVGWMRGQLVMQ